MDQFKLDLYEDEVFVFTPKGDLFKLGKGSTVLDFAFHIHSKLGCKCIGAKVNGKKCTVEADTEQRRPGGNHDVQYTDAQAGLAEHRHHFQGAHQDTAGAQGNGCPPARLCQGDIGA